MRCTLFHPLSQFNRALSLAVHFKITIPFPGHENFILILPDICGVRYPRITPSGASFPPSLLRKTVSREKYKPCPSPSPPPPSQKNRLPPRVDLSLSARPPPRFLARVSLERICYQCLISRWYENNKKEYNRVEKKKRKTFLCDVSSSTRWSHVSVFSSLDRFYIRRFAYYNSSIEISRRNEYSKSIEAETYSRHTTYRWKKLVLGFVASGG